MLTRILSSAFALMLLAVATPLWAQEDTLSDRELLNRPHSGGLSLEDRNRYDELQKEDRKYEAGDQARTQDVLRLPPLPVERNVLLGSWRVEDGDQAGGNVLGLAMGGGTDDMFRQLWSTLESNPDKVLCGPMFGNGITFTPSSYAINALDGSVVRGTVAYRSPGEHVIVAVPGNLKSRMTFEIAGANRILFTGSCALVRVGAPAASAAANVPVKARAAAPPAPLPVPASTRTQESSGLAVGPDAGGYSCPGGRQIWVSHCYDESVQARCQVVHLHVKNNGLNPETSATRAELLADLRDCTLAPLEFGPEGSVSLGK